MAEPRFAGVDVVIGGTVYTVPPLAIRKLREMMPKIQSIEIEPSGLPSEGSMEDVIDVMHAALSRNYTALDREELAEALDIISFPKTLNAVFGASGLVKVPAGNASRAPASPSIGTPSTPDAPPSSDGPGSTSTSS
jgi:hypothetical protein